MRRLDGVSIRCNVTACAALPPLNPRDENVRDESQLGGLVVDSDSV